MNVLFEIMTKSHLLGNDEVGHFQLLVFLHVEFVLRVSFIRLVNDLESSLWALFNLHVITKSYTMPAFVFRISFQLDRDSFNSLTSCS